MPSGGPDVADEAIDRHRLNNELLTERDVIVPAYPGSGHAMLGNILLELGLNYSDPYTEKFDRSSGSTPLPERLAYRRRLAATANSVSRPAPAARFVKTHLYPADFPLSHSAALLLVRDPRDAIYSYYRWRLGFSEEGEDGSFEEFLLRPGPTGVPPCLDWTRFHQAWLAKGRSLTNAFVVRFEDLKRNGPEALAPILRVLAPSVDAPDLRRAFEVSSFEAMRAHEDHVAGEEGAKRIMRRGKVEEWREWFDGPVSRLFQDQALHETASRFGYAEWSAEPRR